MDKIIIKDLEVFANHGYFKEEKALGQKFLISIEVFLNFTKAAKEDDLNKTVHYGILCEEIEKEFKKETFDLIEKATEHLATFVLKTHKEVKKVKVKVKKPWAPIGKSLKYAAVEIERERVTAYIALGSNMGDKEQNIRMAIENTDKSEYIDVKKVSNFYSTKPMGYLDQDDFVNAVMEVETLYSMEELVMFLLCVEKELKRERIIKWGPRTIDLDLILYEDKINTSEIAIVPHPRMHERLFVIEPLCEIAPFVLHPLLNKRIWEIKEDLENK
ncbi:2-amino-4-hydroxy-6-hydroxymethyldihydropteridine pyrophosphokinase [Clostridiaceae bacterium 14S0207]|nr:2-amino-4-hydroxy-6-hydroxymethyldihydropteridine pyrophosphokinase [Clostridiaceae bacterium 14S0207]